MLAYVFWHRPADPAESAAYERSLIAFHAALASDPPAGFLGSTTMRLAEVPWLEPGGRGYEDWYLVDDWQAVGEIERGAVSGSNRSPHDEVAGASSAGAGAIYGPSVGSATSVDQTRRHWFDRPPSISDRELRAALAAALERGGGGLWRRRLVLGPAPEYCLLGTSPDALPHGASAVVADGDVLASG